MLQKIWLQVLKLDSVESAVTDISQNTSTLDDRLTKIETSISNLSGQMTNVTATAGGGCYYTIHTSREYLNGYRVRLTDGTSSKSCIVTYDADSNYYAGVLKAPLGNSVTIEIFDSSTGASQGKLSTTADTTSGYATIDLDALLVAQGDVVVNVNGALATLICKDSYFTKNRTAADVILLGVLNHQEHLQDFVKSSSGVDITSTTFNELYDNTDECIAVANSAASLWMVNSKSVLKGMSQNRDVVTWCNSNGTFKSRLVNTTLPKKTKSAAGGIQNSISGNLICISVQSGSRSGETYFDYEIEYARIDWGSYFSVYKASYIVASAWGESKLVKNGVSSVVAGSGSKTGKYYTEYKYSDSTCSKGLGSQNSYSGRSAYEFNSLSKVGMFADSITVEAYSSISVNVIESGKALGVVNASQTRNNSIITYVDLNS